MGKEMEEDISSAKKLSQNLSFIRWVKGTASDREMRKWDQWVHESARNEKLAQQAQQLILGMDFKSQSRHDKTAAWKKLERRISQRNRSKKVKPPQADSSSKRGGLFRIAAVLLLAATTGLAAYFMFPDPVMQDQSQTQQIEWKTIQTAYQQQKTVALSDGSTITLSANSAIRYPAGWVRGNVTEVYLEGEAYFEISSRENSTQPPFKVITEDGVVEVMGTRFVVATSELDTRVGLEEGKVLIRKASTTNSANTDAETYVMEPNESAQFTRVRPNINIKQHASLEVFTSWINQEIVLDSSPLSYLVYRIEHTYGVQVKVNNEELFQREFTGAIKMKDLQYVIQSISEVIDEEVTIQNDTVYFGNRNQ